MKTRPRGIRPSDLEAAFQSDVIRAAQQMGWHHYHTHDSRRSVAGFPDLVLWRDRVIYAELKVRAAVSPEQRVVLAQLRAAGAEVYVWRPEDWDEIVDTLNKRSRR